MPGLRGRLDPLTPWAERIQTFYGHQMPGTATTRLSSDLWTTLGQRWTDERLCRELWDGFWTSGVLPGDLAPLEQGALGRKGLAVVGLLGLDAGIERTPLTTPVDLLELQAPLALLACRLRMPATDAVARTWLGAWSASRASRTAPQHEAVDLSRARYVLSTTGWPPAMVEEAGLHLWEALTRAKRPREAQDARAAVSGIDPWLLLLNAGAPQDAQQGVLPMIIGEQRVSAASSGRPVGMRVDPRMAVELVLRISADRQRQILRGWLRSPDKEWREAGLAFLAAQAAAGDRARPLATRPESSHGERLAVSAGMSVGGNPSATAAAGSSRRI